MVRNKFEGPVFRHERPISGRPRSLGGERAARTEVDALLRAAATLEAEAGVDELLRTLVEQAAGLLGAERARFIVGSAERFGSNMLWRDGTWVEDHYDGGSASAGGHVWRTGRPYRSNDPTADPRNNQARLTSNHVRSLMVVPLIGDRKERLGLLTVANSRNRDGFSRRDEQLLTAFCRFAGVVIVRARSRAARSAAEDKAARRGHEVEALLRAAATLGEQAEPSQVLEALVEQAAYLLGVERARYLAGTAGDLRNTKMWQNGSWVEDFYEAKPGNTAGFVLRTGRPHRSNDLASDPYVDQVRVAQHELRSVLVVPLLGQNRERLGVMTLSNSRDPDGFSEHDERLLTAFCGFASVILLRSQSLAARLAAEREAARRRREVEALLEVAGRLNTAIGQEDVLLRVVEVAAALFDVKRVNIVTNEGSFGLLRHAFREGVWEQDDFPLPFDRSIAGWVIQHGAPYRCDDMDSDPLSYGRVRGRSQPKTMLCVPITSGDGRVFGAVSVCERRDGAPFSDDDQRLAEGIAHHAATAFERATLTDELQRSTRAVALLEERERIAMDLHDGAIQSLYGVVLRLGARLRTPDQPDPASDALAGAIAQISEVVREIRAYVTGLRSDEQAEVGLVAGMRALVDELQANTSIRIKLELTDTVESGLALEAAASVLQIAREATSNVARHARATAVTARLSVRGEQLRLMIRDNGVGFDVDQPGSTGGEGLRNMAERARILGAQLSIKSEAGRGTRLHLRVPLASGSVRSSNWSTQ